MSQWIVKYSALFVRESTLSGQFTVEAADRQEAIEKAKQVMMAKAKELSCDAFNLNVTEKGDE